METIFSYLDKVPEWFVILCVVLFSSLMLWLVWLETKSLFAASIATIQIHILNIVAWFLMGIALFPLWLSGVWLTGVFAGNIIYIFTMHEPKKVLKP